MLAKRVWVYNILPDIRSADKVTTSYREVEFINAVCTEGTVSRETVLETPVKRGRIFQGIFISRLSYNPFCTYLLGELHNYQWS